MPYCHCKTWTQACNVLIYPLGSCVFIAFFCSFFKAWLDPVFLFEAFSPTKKVEWPPEGILPPDPWSLPFMNTLILLLSGTTITSAHHFLLENDKRA